MEPYMVSNTIKYSDGTETVVNYNQNGDQVEIEAAVAAATDHSPSEEIDVPAEESVQEQNVASEASQDESEASE
jgi:hypothetical protein